MEIYDVIVIGAGQAGLAAGYHLQCAGLNFVILEAHHEATDSWSRYYESLKLFSPARYSSLPGMPFPGNPEHYPTRDEVIAYLRRYAQTFELPILTNQRVERVEQQEGNFLITSSSQVFQSRSLIAATGSFTRPHLPEFEGQAQYKGKILHSSAYIKPEAFKDQRVLIIGAGNSAVQIATELAQVAHVTLTSRETLHFRRQRILGQDIHFWFRITGFDTWQRQFPQWNPATVKSIGVLDTGIYQAAFASGNPIHHDFFERFTEDGVKWTDGGRQSFDTVIFATGFRPNLAYLQGLSALDEHGNALHDKGISTVVSGLYYLGISGQRSFASATLRGVGDDAAYLMPHLKQHVQQAKAEPRPCCFDLPSTAKA